MLIPSLLSLFVDSSTTTSGCLLVRAYPFLPLTLLNLDRRSNVQCSVKLFPTVEKVIFEQCILSWMA